MDKTFAASLLALHDDEVSREQFVRAPFAYPGGKGESIKYLLEQIPYREAYCEPFGGSGALLLARNKSKLEVFNDRHAGVTAFYRCIRDKQKMNQLMDRLELCLHSREEFIWSRDTWNDDFLDDVERAARWWYALSCSFSAKGWAFGRCLKGPNQIGRKLKRNLRFFEPVHNRLLEVAIENCDWKIIFKDFDSKEMVWYLDPPYLQSCAAYDHGFTRADHEELAYRATQLQGFVALSGYDDPDHPYNKVTWTRKVNWRVSVSMKGQAQTDTNNLKGKLTPRTDAVETLWIKE